MYERFKKLAELKGLNANKIGKEKIYQLLLLQSGKKEHTHQKTIKCRINYPSPKGSGFLPMTNERIYL